MEKSMKILLILILGIIGFLILGMIFKYLDWKYFDGFWYYLIFIKSKTQQIEPRYQKFVPLINAVLNGIISVSILVSAVATIYWKIRIKKGSSAK